MTMMAIITAVTMSAMMRSFTQHLPAYEREFGQCHDRGERVISNDFKANSLQDDKCPSCRT